MNNNSYIESLNTTFSINNGNTRLHFKSGIGGIPVVEIRNQQASVIISLQGAHVLSWKPQDQDEVIWLSDDATFVPGKSVRGGIPICWPWFGAHSNNTAYPAHGFARTVQWQVINTQAISEGETDITFSLTTSEMDNTIQQMWPSATTVEYRVNVTKNLTLKLTTYNHSDSAITIGQALHTYFSVNDINNTTVFGLEGKTYLDKPDSFNSKIQVGPIFISSEVDRVYLDTVDDVIIDDKIRKVIIKKQGSHSTVVWNPWKDVAEKMGDLGKNGYIRMLCVESSNAADDVITINPNESHTLLVTYAV